MDRREAAALIGLIGRVRNESEYGIGSFPGRVAVLKARGITNASEDRILREVFPGEPTDEEKGFIGMMWPLWKA